MRKIIVALAGVILVLSACKKGEEPAGDKTLLLTSGSWVLKKWTISNNVNDSGDVVTHYYDSMLPCQHDDISHYKSTGITSMEQGTDICWPGAMEDSTGFWNFDADESHLQYWRPFTNDTLRQNFRIVELTATSLKLREDTTYYSAPVTMKSSAVYEFTSK